MIVLSNLDSLEKDVASLSISKKPECVIKTPNQAFVLGPKKSLTEKKIVIIAPHQAFTLVPKEGLTKKEFVKETATAHGMTRSCRCCTLEELAQGGQKRDHQKKPISEAKAEESVNVVGVGGVNPDETQLKALYNKEVNFLANQRGGYRANYPSPSGNQSWKRDEGWRYRDRDRRDHNTTCKKGEGDKVRYVPPYERQNLKESEGVRTEDMLSRILSKVEGSDKGLKEMKEQGSTLNQTMTSHSVSIKQLETQMGQISSHLNPRQHGGFLSDIMENPKNEA
uniref:Integrase core domain containing protein n=1 Tax=Solanum tuberosum TaxID=4113 RepID=M1DYZ8_SOLTU